MSADTKPVWVEKSLGKNKSAYTCHDPVSINTHRVGRYPQCMPQERTAISSGEGSALQLGSEQVSNQPGSAKHMLAMLSLELASLVFSKYEFDPFGLKAQSSSTKITGRQIIPS